MTFTFNKNIEILYGLSYCINREKSKLKLYNTKEESELIDFFYKIYINNITPEIKEKIISIGDYANLSRYALENKTIDFLDISIFDDYFLKLDTLSDKIINDIKNKNGVNKINLTKLKDFYGFNLTNDIKVYLSMFISGGFGLYVNNISNIILGIKYNKEKSQYGVCGTAVCKIYHEFSHPYIEKIISKDHLKLKKPDKKTSEAYDKGDKTEETLVRVIELIFSSRIFGDKYLKWAIDVQNKSGFQNVEKIIKTYIDPIENIENINDFINILIENNLLIKGVVPNERK